MKKQMRRGRNSLPPPALSSAGYFNPIKKAPNCKKHFVKNPLLPSVFGQNKILRLSQNNLVINTGSKHAGENMTQLLKQRAKDLDPPIQMCDALSAVISQDIGAVGERGLAR
jgi:hypothetical protein